MVTKQRGRGRPRSVPAPTVDDLDDALEVEPEVIETPVMKVVERREYVRPMDETPLSVEPDAESGEFMDDADAAFADFMSEAEGQIPTIRIYKLKDTFRPGAQPFRSAEGAFCDEIPLTSDWLKVIKLNWGQEGGHFRVILMDPNRRGWYKKYKLITIEPPKYPSMPGVPTGQTPGNYTINYPSAPGAPPPDPMKAVKDQIQIAREYAGLLRELGPPNTSQALAPLDPAQNPAIVEMRTKMEMFERMAGLSPEKQEPLLKLVKAVGLFGDEGDSTSGDRWLRLFEGLAPVLQMGLGLLMQRLIPPGGVQGAQPVNQPVAGQLGGIAPQPTAPPDPAGLMLAQVTGLIGTGIQQGQTSGPAIAVIEELTNNFPNSQAAQQCELILNRPPAEVAQQLGIAHPDAVRWIGVLQTNWKLEDDNTTGPLGPPEVMTFGGDAQ